MAFPSGAPESIRFPRHLLSPPPPSPIPYPPPPAESTGQQNAETLIIISLVVLVFLALIDATVDRCIAHIHIQTEEDEDRDLESGEIEATTAFIVSDLNYLNDHPWIMEIVEISLQEFLEDRREQRIRVLEEKLPLVEYKEVEGQENNCNECTICLEVFQEHEPCRRFPVCNHIFHSNCICSWLEENLTCPICRNRCDLALDNLSTQAEV
ncbi:hypothetical protein ACFE04_006138 [Oxalis oulophora]